MIMLKPTNDTKKTKVALLTARLAVVAVVIRLAIDQMCLLVHSRTRNLIRGLPLMLGLVSVIYGANLFLVQGVAACQYKHELVTCADSTTNLFQSNTQISQNTPALDWSNMVSAYNPNHDFKQQGNLNYQLTSAISAVDIELTNVTNTQNVLPLPVSYQQIDAGYRPFIQNKKIRFDFWFKKNIIIQNKNHLDNKPTLVFNNNTVTTKLLTTQKNF